MKNKLSEKDFNYLIKKIELGNEFLSQKKYTKAFDSFFDALQKVPSPKEDWDISLDLFYKLGNCSLLLEKDPSLINKYTEKQLEGIMKGDARLENLRWHHNEQTGIMELVDEFPHEKTAHTGGNTIWGDDIR